MSEAPAPTSLMAQIQAGRKLRPTETKDSSIPRLVEAAEQEHTAGENENYFLDLGMEKWLPLVEDLSFKTVSLPLSPEEACVLRECYAHLHAAGSTEPKPELSQPLLAKLVPLLAKLKPALDQMGPSFVKLSGRSSKDAPLHTVEFRNAYARHLERGTIVGDADDNARLFALFEAGLELMRVQDAAHAAWLLINSQRVDEDLDVSLRHPERWDQAIVVRRWWPGVSVDLEFRMFVVGFEPRALTQYNHLVFSPRLASQAPRLARALCDFYERRVRPRLQEGGFLERFVVDFALHPDALEGGEEAPESGIDDAHVQLIELNCMYEATGMGLFDYHRDAEVLQHGPFECRVVEQPLGHMGVKIENEYRAVLRDEPADDKFMTDRVWTQIRELDACEIA